MHTALDNSAYNRKCIQWRGCIYDRQEVHATRRECAQQGGECIERDGCWLESVHWYPNVECAHMTLDNRVSTTGGAFDREGSRTTERGRIQQCVCSTGSSMFDEGAHTMRQVRRDGRACDMIK